MSTKADLQPGQERWTRVVVFPGQPLWHRLEYRHNEKLPIYTRVAGCRGTARYARDVWLESLGEKPLAPVGVTA